MCIFPLIHESFPSGMNAGDKIDEMRVDSRSLKDSSEDNNYSLQEKSTVY